MSTDDDNSTNDETASTSDTDTDTRDALDEAIDSALEHSGDGSTEDTVLLEFDPPLELDLAPEQERRLREFADAEGMAFPEEVLGVALEVYMRNQGVAETIEVIDDDPELKHAAVEERDPVAQLEIIRRSRVANVYDRERVQELADGHGFDELVAEIGERGRVGYEDLVAEVDDWRGDRS